MKYICLLLAYFLSLVLWSCEDCGVRGEPNLSVSITSPNQQIIRLDTVYALRTIRPVPKQYSSSFTTNGYADFLVPLNLNADSTQYVFVLNGQQGLLTVRYTRDFHYRNNNCGYVYDLLAPRNLPQIRHASTTLGTIREVTYSQNSYTGKFLRPGIDTGINLSIQL